VNVHHLELFFYVSKYGGISSAVRHMPYGIQQPAISGQILQLEEFLGQKLFQRRPFALTPTGERLFRFIQPCFENLQSMSDDLRGHGEKKLRLAASSSLLRDYGPLLLDRLRKQIPDLKLILRESDQSMAENYLLTQEVDLAVTEFHAKPPSGIRSEILIELPLTLLINKEYKMKKAEELLSKQPLPLISTPASTAIYKTFQDGLRRKNLAWEIGIEMSTLEMIQTYAAAGYGIGLSIVVPGVKLDPELQSIELTDFPKIKLAAFWQEPLPTLPRLFLDEIRAEAKRNDMSVR
jgi:DNA-binding transcriptional LysR family regulator